MKEQTYGIRELQRLMARLRDPDTGCPWDLKQTYQSIAPFTLEECLELIDALEQNDFDHVEEELGDLLFQVIFYAQLGKEEGRFDFDTVVSRITTKLLRRHPHVFKDGDLEGVITDRASIDSIKNNWEAEKAAERAARAQQSAMDDIPMTLSALARAQKLKSAVPLWDMTFCLQTRFYRDSMMSLTNCPGPVKTMTRKRSRMS
jgi:ATP diphosphatase